MRVTFPIAVALALTLASQPAAAQSDNAATISKDGLCFGSVPTADGGLGAPIETSISQSVTTKSGVTTVTCHFNIPGDLIPATTTRAVGLPCFVAGTETTDSRMTATPGGQAVLVCRVAKN